MINVQLDTSNLEAAIAEFATLTRKDLGEVTRQQAGILVGHLIAITPPGGKGGQAFTDSGGISLEAKKRGEARMAADISRLFVTTRLPEAAIDRLILDRDFEWENPESGGRKVMVFRKANSMADLAIVHQAARNSRSGRTRQAGGGFMAIARPALVKQYIRQEMAKVGKLNAGWINAARELKTANRAVPAWITRHGAGRGGANVTERAGKMGITLFNSEIWFPNSMESRVALAVGRRERGLVKALDAVLARRAAAAARRMGR